MIKMFQNWFSDRFADPQVVILWVFLISGFLIFYFMGEMLKPIFAGLIIAYLLDGIAKSLESIKLPRIIAVLLTFFLFVVCVILLMLLLLPLLSKQIGQFIHDLPSMIANIQNHINIAYLIIQMIDGHILVPLLFSEVVNIHPVAIIIAILVFGGLWGIWGLFFAIPLATLVHAVLKAWFVKREHFHKQEMNHIAT
jgi:predicted PurR-regulated permease PerM